MDPEQKLAEIEAKRETRLAELAKKETEQKILDLEARERLEEEHGATAAVKVARFANGYPTCALVKTPDAAQYKRYVDQVHKAVEKKNTKAQRDAADLLAQSCWIYPETEEARKAMLDKFPGMLTPIVLAASALAEGRAEDEGKG